MFFCKPSERKAYLENICTERVALSRKTCKHVNIVIPSEILVATGLQRRLNKSEKTLKTTRSNLFLYTFYSVNLQVEVQVKEIKPREGNLLTSFLINKPGRNSHQDVESCPHYRENPTLYVTNNCNLTRTAACSNHTQLKRVDKNNSIVKENPLNMFRSIPIR